MRRQASSTFNKEKLIFMGIAAVLAFCVYNFVASRPVALDVGIPVSPLPIPAPLAAEKAEPRKANVDFYLQTGQYEGLAINRERNDPFAPIYVLTDAVPNGVANTNQPGGVKPIVAPVELPKPPDGEEKDKAAKDEPKFGPKDAEAKVKFSAVMAMNGSTYGLLTDDDGKTMKVKVGDYMEDFKYTVSRIDKQAIWVTDDTGRQFVARDLSFAGDGSGGDVANGDEKTKKKDKAQKGPPKNDGGATSKPPPGGGPDPTAALAKGMEAMANLIKSQADRNGVMQNPNGGRKNRKN